MKQHTHNDNLKNTLLNNSDSNLMFQYLSATTDLMKKCYQLLILHIINSQIIYSMHAVSLLM